MRSRFLNPEKRGFVQHLQSITEKVTNSVKSSLLIAFRYMLKPLVRIGAKNGVLFPEFSEALKEAYVDVAAKQMRGANEEMNEERVFLRTGVSATDIGRILERAGASEFEALAQETSPLATVLMAWHTDAKFSGPYGVLRDLEFECVDRSGPPSFTELVNKYCQGSSPKQLLEELLASGSVVSVGANVYRAVTRSYVPSNPLSAQNILLFARLVHNVADSAEVNLRSTSVGGKGLVERTVYTEHGISKDELQAFDKFVRPRVQNFIDDIDNWISERDKPGRQDGVRTGIGVYHFIVNEDEDSDLSKRLSN
jgi:hypothetical protein